MRKTLVMFLRESSCTVVVGSLKWKMRDEDLLSWRVILQLQLLRYSRVTSLSSLMNRGEDIAAAQFEDDVVDDDERGQ
jgi:hypothetical protein